MNHVILIGFMGCGKRAALEKKLAETLGVPFVDTDVMIEEQTCRKISDIFQESGETYFRDLETSVLKRLLTLEEPRVVAVGGGLPVRPVNQEYLKQMGTVVYLTAGIDTLTGRLEGDTARPMLRGGGLRERIEDLMDARGGIYTDLAELQVVTDGKDLRQIAEEIREYVR